MKIHKDNVEHYKPDRATEKRIQTAAKVQKTKGIHYGEQVAKIYLDRHGVERVKVEYKLWKAVQESPYSMNSLSKDLGYEGTWLSQRIRDKSRIEMRQLRRICTVIRKRPEDVIED